MPKCIQYQDKTEGYTFVGVHLTKGDGHQIGDPWASRNPQVVGHIDSFLPDCRRGKDVRRGAAPAVQRAVLP